MTNPLKQIDQLKKAMLWTIFSVLIIATSFGYILLKNTESLHEKDLKISTLVSEVGVVKESLDTKDANIRAIYSKLELINKYINDINNQLVEAVNNKQYDWDKLAAELDLTQNEINSLLLEKEQLLDELAQKKNDLHGSSIKDLYSSDIIDILLLGQHKQLVDTLILVSINPSNQTISLTSLPRDLYYEGRKINELYSKYGIIEVQNAINDITGVRFDKYVVFDFQSFIEIVDMLGGIDIEVEKEIIDYAYPGANSSYTTVSFSPGITHMDGQTALKYARSRKSTSDFDRSYRQQQVITSVKNKAEQQDILLKLDFALKMYAKISDNIKTNINVFEALSYLQSYKSYTIESGNVISTSNYLYSTKSSSGQYILLPIAENYSEIHKFFSELILK